MLGQELAKVFADNEFFLWDKEELDITDVEMAAAKLAKLKPDLIINSAAYNNVDDCETNFELANKINSDGPQNLARIAKDLGATLVHYSTDYVFPGTNPEGYLENDQPEPRSKYAESKLGGEAVLNLHDKVYLVRTSRLFGRPATSEGAKKSFVDVMLKLGREKESLDLVHEEYSNPTYVVDLAQRTKEILVGDYEPGIYHVVNEGACTWYEFANEIFKQAGINVKINPVGSDKFPRPAKRPAYSSLINTKLPKMRTWQEALSEYLRIRVNESE